jgi:hypothetical protein
MIAAGAGGGLAELVELGLLDACDGELTGRVAVGLVVGLVETLGVGGVLESMGLSDATVGPALGRAVDDATTGRVMGFRGVVALLVQPAMVARATMPAITIRGL